VHVGAVIYDLSYINISLTHGGLCILVFFNGWIRERFYDRYLCKQQRKQPGEEVCACQNKAFLSICWRIFGSVWYVIAKKI